MSPRGIMSSSQSKVYAQKYAQEKLKESGYDKKEWSALKTLWNKESRWKHDAQNANSSAYRSEILIPRPVVSVVVCATIRLPFSNSKLFLL